jgi:diguanylate cyclase (GGDEF)-like protein
MQAVTRARAGFGGAGPGAAIAVVDADHFKTINDTYGHGAGDAVLVALCDHLSRELPQGAIVGRLGGEEFGVYLPADLVLDRPHLLEELRRGVSLVTIEHQPPLPMVTVSIGAASLPAGPLDFSRALARADKALYASKKAGRNCVTWAALENNRGDRPIAEASDTTGVAASTATRSAA